MSPDVEERVLILAPMGRDSAVAEGIFREAGVQAKSAVGLDELVRSIESAIGCIVITQEAILTADLRPLFNALAHQPSWSDLPFVVITERGGGPERNPGAIRLMDTLGNVTFVERPFHPSTLLSVVQSALRSRRRQYQARTQLIELQQREMALKDSEARFRTLAENIPVFAWTADPGGNIFWFNSRWYEYTGTNSDDMQNAGWLSFVEPGQRPEALKGWRRGIRDGEAFDAVLRLRGTDGAFREFLTRVAPVRQGGKVVRWFGTSVDISVERAAQAVAKASEEKLRFLNETLEQQIAERTERLRSNEARLRTIFETSNQAQAFLNIDGTIVDTNSTSLQLVDSSLGDLVGKKFWDTPWFAATPGMPRMIKQAVFSAAEGNNVFQEISINLSDEQRTFELSVRPIRDENGDVVGIVPEALEITARRRAEETLRQAQKMEAIGQLTGGIAHDFNNMLQGIAGGVELMRRRIKEGRLDDTERYMEAAQQSIERAAALTHRLLAFSRRQSLAPRNMELDGLVQAMGGLIRQTVGPSIDVNLELRDDCWPVNCDPNQLENALLNLAINARDAMLPDGGKLTIQTEHEALDDTQLAGWETAKAGDYVKISLIDTGAGMPPDVLKHAFEPFFTTKPAGQGTGLGLSQVFGFASQSNGMMNIESKMGEGTSVHLFLPRALGESEQKKTAVTNSREIRCLSGSTILLVEDEANIRDLAVEILRDIGCNVIEAGDGSSALHILRTNDTGIDMLITDVGLPGGLNGRQLADAARELYPSVPVLLITGYAGDALGKGIAPGNGMELLTKPFTLDTLASRVETMLMPGWIF